MQSVNRCQLNTPPYEAQGDKATIRMGINPNPLSKSKAFAKDVLSIEIEGPSRPQLTLVDLPGLNQTETRGVLEEDVQLVMKIIDHYISQPRTICLTVVSTGNDYANQGILKKVRKVDLEGNRMLGIIKKTDRLPSGSDSEYVVSISRSCTERRHSFQTRLICPEESKL